LTIPIYFTSQDNVKAIIPDATKTQAVGVASVIKKPANSTIKKLIIFGIVGSIIYLAVVRP
jgi:hypothetical protein